VTLFLCLRVDRWLPVRAGARVWAVLVLSAAVACGVAAPVVQAQDRQAAVVTHVIDGDTLDARLADGRNLTVRLIGIDSPETKKPGTPVECGGEQATAKMEQLAEGRDVSLVSDPTQDQVDRDGRSLFYVDRTDGVDVGEEMLRAGWAEVYIFNNDFQRLPQYREAQGEARDNDSGVWSRCGGDFHRSHKDELRAKRRSAERFMRSYYRHISHRRFRTAWRMLGTTLHRKNGSLRRWKAGYRRSLGTLVRSAHARLSGRRAVVAVSIRSRDRDACSGRVMRQYFRGKWVLAPRGNTWVATRVKMRKTAGGRVRISKSECHRSRPRPSPSPRPRPRNCQGYSPCISPGPDVDCAGGSGNGPRYVNGPVQVNGSDPYDLDRDGDGVGCDS
jgi:micrococcal nuclease